MRSTAGTFRTGEIAGASHAGAAGGIGDIIAVFTRDDLQVPTGEIGSSSGALGLPANPNFPALAPHVHRRPRPPRPLGRRR